MSANFCPDRRTVLRLARSMTCGAALAAGLGGNGRAETAPETLVLQLDSAPGADHGGIYAAMASGLFRQAGLDLHVRSGGVRVGQPRPNPVEALAAGADMVLCPAVELAMLAARNQPILAIAAFFQKSPRAVFCHPGQGFDDLAKVKGRPILMGAQGRAVIWPYLRAKFGFADDQLRPYVGDTSPFLADKRMCLEGSLTGELIDVEKDGGIRPLILPIAESGIDPYDGVLAISPAMPAARRPLVQAALDAMITGWASYLASGAASEAARALIRASQPDLAEERLSASRTALIERALIAGGDAQKAGIGTMTAKRWKALAEELITTNLIRPDFDISHAYTLAFLNREGAP